jgi:uncharacterized protein YycO
VVRVERYGKGQDAGDVSAGDFILAHRHHFLAALISQAQRRRFRGDQSVYAHWSHCALVETSTSLIEAEIDGVVRSPLSKYRSDEYHLVRVDLDPIARERAVGYARAQVGQAFGFLDMFGASLYLLTGRPVRMVRANHEICSSLVVRALQQGGLLNELDPALTLPADLAKAFDVR